MFGYNLIEEDSSVSIHDRNIYCLATEIYKVSNRLSPPVVTNIFTQKIVTLTVFKNRIIKWKPENCPCRIWKTYISRVGFT